MAQYMDKIRDLACDELEKIAQKGKIADRGEAQLIDWLTHTIKSIDTIDAMEEAGYSERGYSYNYSYDGDYSESRGRGRNARRDSMGRYSREGRGGRDGSSNRGYSRDGYSREGRYSRGDMMEHLQMMMDEAQTEQEREKIRRWMADAEKN